MTGPNIINEHGETKDLYEAVRELCIKMSTESKSCKECPLGYHDDIPVYLCMPLSEHAIHNYKEPTDNTKEALKRLNWRLV